MDAGSTNPGRNTAAFHRQPPRQHAVLVLLVEYAPEQAASPCARICRKISRRLYENPPKYAIAARFRVPCDSDNSIDAQGKFFSANCAIGCATFAVAPPISSINYSQAHLRTRSRTVPSQPLCANLRFGDALDTPSPKFGPTGPRTRRPQIGVPIACLRNKFRR